MSDHDEHRWEDDGGPPEPTDREIAHARRVLLDDPQTKVRGRVRIACSELKDAQRVSFAMGMMNFSSAEADPTYEKRFREAVEARVYGPFFARARSVIERIRYKPDHWFELLIVGENMHLRLAFPATDEAMGQRSVQRSRHWVLTPDMSDADIVRTALLAVLTAEEHEAREAFTLDGKPLFGPHFAIPA